MSTQKGTKSVNQANSVALEKAIEVGYAHIKNPDGSRIKVRAREGYMGVKQFESLEGSNDAEAQPGSADRAIVESEDGRFVVQFPLFIRPIGTMRSHSLGGTVRNIQAEGMSSGDAVALRDEFIERLNRIMAYGREKGVATEISKRLAGTIYGARWLWRNYSDDVVISVKRISFNKETGARMEHFIDGVDAFAKEIEEALFDPEAKFHKKTYSISATVYSMQGAEIYPSQQMTAGDAGIPKGYSKLLVVDHEGCALMTPQKLMNAIRTYDSWTAGEGDEKNPIPVSATSGSLRRTGKGAMTLLTRSDDVATAEQAQDDDYFVIANIVHGGLFTYQTKKKEDDSGAKIKGKRGKKAETVDPETGEIQEA